MCRPAFDALDRSWATLVHSHEAAAALDRWASEPLLAAPDLDTLVDRIWAVAKPAADRAHAALAARAPSDPTAARVLLQVLRPGLRNLGRRLALGGIFDDVDVELLSLAWERIRTYPIGCRPRAIAANVLLDVRKRYIRDVVDAKPPHFEYLSEDLWPPAPSAEHEAIEAFERSLRRAHAHLAAAGQCVGGLAHPGAAGRRRGGRSRPRREPPDHAAPPPARRAPARSRQLSAAASPTLETAAKVRARQRATSGGSEVEAACER